MDFFRINRQIAYQGNIGQQRRDFCLSYTEKKKDTLKAIAGAQLREAAARGETITCTEGCAYCCLLHVEATIQECEAVVYYLYHHEAALNNFLRKYPAWRSAIRKNGDLFRRLGVLSREIFSFQFNRGNSSPDYIARREHEFTEEQQRYAQQNIACPFLDNQLCSIYEVRPYNCAGFSATSPAAWCNPLSPQAPRIHRSDLPAEVIVDLDFYYKPLKGPVFSFLPLAVYEILKEGYAYLATIPGFEDLELEAVRDPKVDKILKNIRRLNRLEI